MKRTIIVSFLCLIFLFGCGTKNNLDVETQSKSLNQYTMELQYNVDNTLFGNQTLTYINKTDTTLTKLCFHLYPKAFSEGAVNKPISVLNQNKAYPNGFNPGDIVINLVKVNNAEAKFDYCGTDNNVLNVYLGFELQPMDKVDVTIEYLVQVPNVNHRFGYGNNTINLANFYPIVAVFENGEFVLDPYNSNGDPFYSDVANYTVKITTPSNLVLASTGGQDNRINTEDTSTYYLSAKAVRDFAIVLSEKFQTLTKQVEDVIINYYYYDDNASEVNLQAAADALITFNKLFGDYPYKTLSVVKTNFVHGGMEYPNLVYVSDEVTGADYTNVIIHEIAHQWWYGVVGSNAFREAWLDEGLTEYSTALFYEENPNYGIDYNELVKTTTNSYVTFVDLYSEVLGNLDTSMTRHVNQYDTEPEYVYMTYVKGMLLFDNLRGVIGKNKLIQGLQHYYKTNAFKNVNHDYLIDSIEKASRTELGNYFKTWLEGKVIILSKP